MALDITFVGIKPNGKCFDFSVVNNAKVDVINFILTTPLDSVNTLEQLSNLNAYVKVESAGGDYIDKISATSVYDSENEKLTISFTLHKKTTSYKNIALQLQFEDLQNEVISQTEIVALSLKGTINADKEVSDKYPEAIQELEKEVGSYSGRIEEVEEKVANAVLKTDIVDNLDSEDDKKVLSAKQGKVLNEKISNAISGVYKPQGTTTVATLNALIITEEMNGFVYDMLDSGTLTKGSVQVMEGDNVAIIWNEDKTDWKWDKLSGLVDLTAYYTKAESDQKFIDKTSEQEIEGKKTIKDTSLDFSKTGVSGNAKWVLEEDSYGRLTISRIYNGNKVVYWTYDGGNLSPNSDNANTLGSSSKKIAEFFVNLLNKNANGKGLTLPDTTNFTANKEIATTDLGKLLTIESQRHLTSGEAKQCVGGIQVVSDYFLNLGNGILLKNPYITGIQVASNLIDITAIGLNTTQQMVMYSGRLTINTSDDTIAVSENNITTRVLSELATTDQALNVINASDIVGNTLTQAQYDLITNGKPTLIKGTLQSITNGIITGVNSNNNFAWGTFIGSTGALENCVSSVFITKTDLRIYLSSPTETYLTLRGVGKFNGKVIPAYPIDTTKQYKFVQKVGGNLDYVEDDTPIKIDYSSSLFIDNSANLTIKRSELYFVKTPHSIKLCCYFSAKNESGSAINAIRIINTNIVVSDDFIKANLKDMNGVELSSATAGIVGVAGQNIYYDGNMIIKPIRVQHSSTNQLILYDGSAVNLPNDGSLIIEFEKEWFVG